MRKNLLLRGLSDLKKRKKKELLTVEGGWWHSPIAVAARSSETTEMRLGD